MSVTVARVTPVSVEVKVTGAFGTTESVWSTTVPCNALETVCPKRQAVKNVAARTTCVNLLILIGIISPLKLSIKTTDYLIPTSAHRRLG